MYFGTVYRIEKALRVGSKKLTTHIFYFRSYR